MKTARQLTRTNTRSLVSELADGGVDHSEETAEDDQILRVLAARVFGIEARERLEGLTRYGLADMTDVRSIAAEWRVHPDEPGSSETVDRIHLRRILDAWLGKHSRCIVIDGEAPPLPGDPDEIVAKPVEEGQSR